MFEFIQNGQGSTVESPVGQFFTWSWTADISDIIVAIGVVAAFFVGVGNWIRESRINRKNRHDQKDACGLYFLCELVNLKLKVERLKLTFLEAFKSATADDGTRSAASTRLYTTIPEQLKLAPLLTHDTGTQVAMILPPKLMTNLCSVQYVISLWNENVENKSLNGVKTLSPDLQDSTLEMLDLIDKSLSEASEVLNKETQWGITEKYADEINLSDRISLS